MAAATTTKKKAAGEAKTATRSKAAEKPLGRITHLYGQIGVAVVTVQKSMKLGDKVRIGKNDAFIEQEIKSMQYNHQHLTAAKKGQEIGMKVDSRVRVGDSVFKV